MAEYLKRVTEMLCHSPYCDGVSLRDEIKTIKLITNEAFVASSGDIITDNIIEIKVHQITTRRLHTDFWSLRMRSQPLHTIQPPPTTGLRVIISGGSYVCSFIVSLCQGISALVHVI